MIQSDNELIQYLDDLKSLYIEHRRVVVSNPRTEKGAVQLIKAGAKIVNKITSTLNEIEGYTGVSEMRVALADFRRVSESRRRESGQV